MTKNNQTSATSHSDGIHQGFVTGVDLATTINDVVRAQIAAGMAKLPLTCVYKIVDDLGLSFLGMRVESAHGNWVAFLRAGRALVWYRTGWLDKDPGATAALFQIKKELRGMGFENVSAWATTGERVEKFRTTRQWPHKPYSVDRQGEESDE